MSVFNYLIGNWSNPKEVPKPLKPLLAKLELPDMTNMTVEEQKAVVEDLINTMVFNNKMSRNNKEETKAYNNAVFDAIQNQMMEAREQAQAQGRSRSETKKILNKSIQQSMSANKSLQKAFISKMANQWLSNRARDSKRSEKVKKEGS